MAHPLPLTGERTLPGVAGEEYWFARHERVYRWVSERYAHAATLVVDAGAGEGYGSAMLRRSSAGPVVAVDCDPAVVRHVAATYPLLHVVRANLDTLPLRDGAADLVVALQVVEHLWDVPRFLRECRRVLRGGGALVLSTPNRPVFSPGLGRGEAPLNPFHSQEYDADQLAELVAAYGFPQVRLAGVQHGARIRAWERAHGVGVVAAQVAALTAREPDRELDAFVSTVTQADFDIGRTTDAQDLLLTAAAP